jgi:hypothetical protein
VKARRVPQKADSSPSAPIYFIYAFFERGPRIGLGMTVWFLLGGEATQKPRVSGGGSVVSRFSRPRGFGAPCGAQARVSDQSDCSG